MAKTRSSDAPRPGAGRYTDLSPDKLRGGYYTPADLTEWMAAWCIRSADDRVLEPSCGDGAFLTAVAKRLLGLGAKPEAVVKHVQGVEVTQAEATKAIAALGSVLKVAANGAVTTGDFFEWCRSSGRGAFDAVIGNPPFIRYQSFPEPSRGKAMEMMFAHGLRPNRLTNSWVPFVVASVSALVPGGRMGLVLPAELLQVTYAAQLRRFLVDSFRAVHVIACNELFFDKAEQEVVVFLAHDRVGPLGPHDDCSVAVTATTSRHSLLSKSAETVIAKTPPKVVRHEDEKWLKYFLSQPQIDLLRALRACGVATTLDKFASVDVGVVTGKNEFFVVNDQQVGEWQLSHFVVPLAARAAHLSGAIFDRARWEHLVARGERAHLLQLGHQPRHRLPYKALQYVAHGETRGYHTGYKCSVRQPWYAVPGVWAPDAFLLRQIHDFPRVLVNRAGATCTDTVHRMTVHQGPAEIVAAMCFTSLTAASAEIEGRSYGGGVLELEPTEAERLLVPSSVASALDLSEIDFLIREGRVLEVLDFNDRTILGAHLGLSVSDRELLRSAWDVMRERRQGRRRLAVNPEARL